MATQWQVTEEFSQRLGCGALTALVMPVWFAVMWFALSGNGAAVLVCGVMFVVAAVAGAAARHRIRALPRTVEVDAESDRLRFISRRGETERPAHTLRGVVVSTSVGLAPVRLDFAEGRPVRLPRELEGFDSFLAALRQLVPDLPVVDRGGGALPPRPVGQGPG